MFMFDNYYQLKDLVFVIILILKFDVLDIDRFLHYGEIKMIKM